MKLIWKLIKGNPFKSISIILLILSSVWWWNTSMENVKYELEIINVLEIGGDYYFLLDNDDSEYVVKKTSIFDDEKYLVNIEDSLITYTNREMPLSMGFSFFFMLVFLISIIAGHWEDGYYKGWEYKKIKERYLYSKVKVEMVDGESWYILNGKILNKGQLLYRDDLYSKIGTYMTNPNLYHDYVKIVRDEKKLRGNKIEQIMSILDDDTIEVK